LDSVFTDRPSYAASADEPDVVDTPYGLLDARPAPGEAIIARNLGVGPGFVVVNLRLSKTIPFKGGRTAEPPPGGGRPGGGPGGRGGGLGGGGLGGRGGGRGEGGGRGGEGGRGVTLSVSAQNLFNRVTPAAPIGNISSPLFGQSVATAGGFG